VKEQSHKDDMRAAIRGDFQRLAERRQVDSAPRESRVEPVAPEPAQAVEPEPSPVVMPAGEEPVVPERRSWLRFVLGR
jgi:hypothetical protein